MAKTFNGYTKEEYGYDQQVKVDPFVLIVDPEDRGRAFPPSNEEVVRLAADIAANTQLHAITGVKTKDGKIKVIAGFTRLEAIKLLNQQGSPIRALVNVVEHRSPEEQFIINISENQRTNPTTAIDDAVNIRRLKQFGFDDEKILTIYGGKTITWLSGRLKLLELPSKRQKEIHEGQLAASVGEFLADFEPAVQEQLIEETRKDEQERVSKKGSGKAKTSVKTLTKTAEKLGVKPVKKTRKAAAVEDDKPSAREIQKGWEYLAEGEHPTAAKIAKIVLKRYSGAYTEPDFFGQLKRALNSLES